jgi:hypothetical protein
VNYKEAVRRGKELVAQEGDIKWQLGDLALTVAPMGERTGPNGSTEPLARFAEDIGVEFSTLQGYRQVAAAWEFDARASNTPWTVHRILLNHQDLLKPHMTVTQASNALGHKNIARAPVGDPTVVVPEIRAATPEQRKKILRDLVDDEELNDEINDARFQKLEDRLAVEDEHRKPGQGGRIDPGTLKPTEGDNKLMRFHKALGQAVGATSVLREMVEDPEVLVMIESYGEIPIMRKQIRWSQEGLMAADSQLEIVEDAMAEKAS